MSKEQAVMFPKVDYTNLEEVKQLAQACTDETGTQHDVIPTSDGKYAVMITECRGWTHSNNVVFTTVKTKNN